MNDMTEAEAKDEILKYLIANKNSTLNAEEVTTKLFSTLNEDEARLIIERIINADDEIVKVYDEYESYVSIQASGLTLRFINDQGGFVDIENKEKAEAERVKETATHANKSQMRIQQLTIENLELQNKQLKSSVLFGIISFIAGALLTNIGDILIFLKILPQE